MKIRLPHVIHRDPNYQIRGANVYLQCTTCGARRVLRGAYRGGPNSSPVAPGWPVILNWRNVPISDTGWVKKPNQGWK